jgi:hypothetical protein
MTQATPSPGSNPGTPRASISLDDLPVAMRDFALPDAVCTATHIFQMLDSSFDAYQGIMPNTPDERAAVEKLGAFLWIARDLAEILAWKLGRLEKRELADMAKRRVACG